MIIRAFFVLAALTVSTTGKTADPVPTHANVSYDGEHSHQLIDIYLPKKGAPPFPAVLWFGDIWKAAKHPANLAFIVLMAGVGVPMDQVLVRQAADLMRIAGAGEAMTAKQNELQRELMRLVRANGPPQDTQSKVRGLLHESVNNISKEDAVALGLSEAMIDAQATMISSP